MSRILLDNRDIFIHVSHLTLHKAIEKLRMSFLVSYFTLHKQGICHILIF